MNENVIIALQMTLVGMGLVFAALMVLGGMMALLVRATAETEAPLTHQAQKEKAAAVAVAVALAREASLAEPHPFPLPPTAFVSAWQAVMRTNSLDKRGPVR